MNKWYDIKALSNSADIWINGDIGESWLDESVTAKKFVEDLSSIKSQELTVHINSYGGSVSDGLVIYNAIKNHPAKVSVIVEGVAVSIASLIAMSGDSLKMRENAMMMIHAPWSFAEGNAKELRASADVLDKLADSMSHAYALKTGISRDNILALLNDGENHWYTAREALDFKLIDGIIEPLKIAASLDLSRYKDIPNQAKFFIKSQQETEQMKKQHDASASDDDQGIDKSSAVKPAPEETAAPINADEIKASALAGEQQRRADVKARFKPFSHLNGVNEVLDACLDNSGMTVSSSVEKLMNKLGENMAPTAGNYTTRIETGETSSERFARDAEQSILARCGVEKHDAKNELRTARLEDIAKACLERSGQKPRNTDRVSLVKAALALRPMAEGGANSTSDFAVLLENVMHKQVLTAYHLTPDNWSKFCARGSVSDFREWNRLRVGSIADIDDVLEGGEYKNKNIPDAAKESVTAKRRGNIISITPETIINDDIGYISQLTSTIGRAAKRTIESKVFALLTANPTMKDGNPLFHASHNNLSASGAIPSVDSFDAARIAMAKQQDIGKNEYLDIRPNIWLGGMARGGDVRVIVGAQYDPDTANKLQRPNKVNGLVQNIVDTPRIQGNEWYFFADPSIAPVIEVVFLDGQSEPMLAIEEDFRTAGLSYRVELPFGVGVIGYEGAYKNIGA